MTEKQREAFCKNIKHLLIDKHVTQRELAISANVSDAFLSMVLNGVKTPPFSVVLSIAETLGVTVDDLIK